MKTPLRNSFCVVFALILTAATPLTAQLSIPSDGSDGPLVVATNTVIDLSKAVTAAWNANNSANAGKGVYDSNKWAVVFKYSSVTISNGASLSFLNHPSSAPVVWLVKGDVIINGWLSVDGGTWQTPPRLANPGPGGFRGGFGSYASGVGPGPGFGPGGGQNYNDDRRSGGSYGTVGYWGPVAYGNPSLLPLIGGSGGSGDTDGSGTGSSSGGGGGGAILVACAGDLLIGDTGRITANGGNGGPGSTGNHSAGGSGGGIRLVSNTLSGAGQVSAFAGGGYHGGGLGRIRIERVGNSSTAAVTPDPSVVTLQAGATPLIWLPTSGPTARVVSIGSVSAPLDPRASFDTAGADVTLPQGATTPVVVETTNVEDASVVTVRVTPRANGAYSETKAMLVQTNSLVPLILRWQADVPVNSGYSAVQVKVVRP